MAFYFLIIALLVQLSGTNGNTLERIPNENCSFSFGQHTYDLSSLSHKMYWSYLDHTLLLYARSYAISICHPLTALKNCEDSNGCYRYIGNRPNQTNISIGKIMSADHVPEFIEDGHLRYHFTNGSKCPRGTGFLNYSTQLFLHCPVEDEKESYGPVLMNELTCSYIFVWITKAACPIKHKIEDPTCTILFDNDSSVNFNSLTSLTYHSVKSKNSSYEINVCSPIVNGTCPGENVSICDISNITDPKPIALYKDVVLDWNSINGNFDYKFNSGANILFECDRKMIQPELSIIDRISSENSTHYDFKMKTIFACLSIRNNCVLRNLEGYIIDLRPLRRNTSNWEVILPFSQKKNAEREMYLLNICGPLVSGGENKCSAGAVGACKPTINAQGSLNLGYVTSDPVVQSDGSIIVSYKGGDLCSKYSPSASTQITLYCSETDHLPVLITVTSSCMYIFEWRTPTACPIKSVIGKDCKVVDPVMSEVFDLNPLRNLSADYAVHTAAGKFRLNVCGNLLSDCNGLQSSVCVVDEKDGHNKTTVSGGMGPGHLSFDDGTLIMDFKNGGSCGTERWTTKILVLCNQVAMTTAPQHFQTDVDSCTHLFIWHTIHACPSFTSVDCFVHDGANVYDLTALSEPTANWDFENSQNGTTRRFVFNVCRSIVHSKANRCSYKSGSCLLDDGQGGARNLGNVMASPVVENGTVLLHYTNGDLCTNMKRYETLLVFECVPWAYNNVPILMKEGDCQYVIKVPTNHACPQKPVPQIEPVTGNCSIANPLVDYGYDFSSLNAAGAGKMTFNNDTIYLNVCDHLNSSVGCSAANAGACWLMRGNGSQPVPTNMGVANARLQFSRWNTFLEYKDGDPCYSERLGHIRRGTRISFVCSAENYVRGPKVVDYDADSCTLYVNWHTQLACEVEINCYAAAKNGQTILLAGFTKFFGNYKIADPSRANTTYYMNICKPLNPIAGIRCHPGSSGCMVVESEDGTKSISSLGHALMNPVAQTNDDVALMYSHGSSCPTEGLSGTSLSSRITFVCNRSIGVGTPAFVRRTHDCHMLFEWHTSLTCPDEVDDVPSFGTQCQIYMTKAKANVDINPLYKPGGYNVTHAGKNYLVNVCGPVCNTSGVCSSDGDSYGLLSNVVLNWESDMLKLAYYSGEPCSNALTLRRSSSIYFECDMDAGYGAPVAEPWNRPDSCMIVFVWRTNVTCMQAIYTPTRILPTTTPVQTAVIPAAASNVTASPASIDADTGSVGVSILISVLVIGLVVIVFGMVFLRSVQGRRLTTQAKGFFQTKGDEVFILDDQHYHIVDM